MRAKRSLGQNFLVDPNLQRKIVEAVDAGPGDTVIEIGPGMGALTDRLAGSVRRLIAIELDDRLAAALTERYADDPTVEIIHADILDWEPDPAMADGARVVGNIPYNITSPLLFRLLEWRATPERVVVMVQKEVADRLRAEPGDKAYGALTVGVRAIAEVDRQFDVGRQAFRPVPNVDSSVLLLRLRTDAPRREPALRALTRAAFGMRRKQMQKILRTAPGYGLDPDTSVSVLDQVGVRPADRPATMDPDTFVRLAAALRHLGYPTEGAAA